MGNTTEHFDEEEFYCKCKNPMCHLKKRPSARLSNGLEELRQHLGRPLFITSAWRHPRSQRDKSYHVYGQAADCRLGTWQRPDDLLWLYRKALKVQVFKEGGVGLYPPEEIYTGAGSNGQYGFIHLDVRPCCARWSRMKGKYISIDHAVEWLEQHRFAGGKQKG